MQTTNAMRDEARTRGHACSLTITIYGCGGDARRTKEVSGALTGLRSRSLSFLVKRASCALFGCGQARRKQERERLLKNSCHGQRRSDVVVNGAQQWRILVLHG
ncbi:unnamed protein product [Toxocara canis]|uniref:DUF1534 domain-containing protein n=1 Tax=Toxocara canis TaxID=6265 RepID=A0A183UZS3_TOXCA|nr:unnamed protein product [Toxocara canis]